MRIMRSVVDQSVEETENSANPEQSFRISVSLDRFFDDERTRCYLSVPRTRRVRWLRRRLRALFPLPRRIALLTAGHLLPPDEPLALLRPDDRVDVVPIQARADSVDTEDTSIDMITSSSSYPHQKKKAKLQTESNDNQSWLNGRDELDSQIVINLGENNKIDAPTTEHSNVNGDLNLASCRKIDTPIAMYSEIGLEINQNKENKIKEATNVHPDVEMQFNKSKDYKVNPQTTMNSDEKQLNEYKEFAFKILQKFDPKTDEEPPQWTPVEIEQWTPIEPRGQRTRRRVRRRRPRGQALSSTVERVPEAQTSPTQGRDPSPLCSTLKNYTSVAPPPVSLLSVAAPSVVQNNAAIPRPARVIKPLSSELTGA